MTLTDDSGLVWRTGLWGYGFAAVERSRDVRTVRSGTAFTRRGATRKARKVIRQRQAVETLLWPT